MHRLPLTVAVAVCALLLVASAEARRAPTSSERAAIRTAVATYVARADSRAAPDTRVVRIFVSTVDSRYALAKLRSAGASATAILKRRAHGWKVIRFGTGGFVRFGIPRRVVEDLLGGKLCGCH